MPPSDPSSPSLETTPDAAIADAPAGSLARATAVMSVGTTLSRVTGFVRVAVMAWAIGGVESKLPDTYNLANTMPNMVYQLVIGEILATIFVPVFVEALAARARREAWRLASGVLVMALAVAAVFALVTVVAAPWLIKIYTFRIEDPVLRAAQEETGAFFLRLFMPQMIFYAAGMVLTGLLNAHRRFAAPMFAPILNNLTVIGTFVAFRLVSGAGTQLTDISTGGKLLLGLGTTAGVIAMTLALLPSVRRLRGEWQPGIPDRRDPAIRRVGALARYSFAYVIANMIGLWVVKALANRIQGGVAAYDASFILYQLPYGIFAVSVFTALVPALSEHHVRGDHAAFRRDLSLGLRTTSFVILPATAGFVALGRPIVRLLLERGAFTASSTELFADTFTLMAIGLGAYAAFQQLMRAFYSMQDARTPWLVNSVGVVVNVATAYPLMSWLGVPGLGLSHAISYLAALACALVVIRRRLGGIDGRRLASSHARIAAAAALTGAAAWAVGETLARAVDVSAVGGRVLQVGAATAAGLILYSAVALVLKLDEFRPLVRLVAGRFGRPARAKP